MMKASYFLYGFAPIIPTIAAFCGDVSSYLYATILFAWFLAGAFLFKGE